MAIRIVTDSASDILPAEAEQLGIKVVPLTLTWDGKEYKDAVDMNHEEFFNRLTSSSTIPTTSQVPPDAFVKAFKEITKTGDSVIAITISSELSGTCQSANLAANDVDGEVYVVDSLSATIGQRILILQTLKYIEEGLDIKSIADRINEDKKHIRILAKLDTLEYLKKGGRISSAVAMAGELLSIKPVISVDDGAISLKGKARGSKNANNLLRKFVEEVGELDLSKPFGLVYSGLSDELLQEYINNSKDLWEGRINDLPRYTIGAVIGTHIGPGAIGLSFFVK